MDDMDTEIMEPEDNDTYSDLIAITNLCMTNFEEYTCKSLKRLHKQEFKRCLERLAIRELENKIDHAEMQILLIRKQATLKSMSNPKKRPTFKGKGTDNIRPII